MGKPFKPLGIVGNPLAPVRCSALGPDGLCTQYELRPLICRLFGTMQHPFMKCEHGCKPERWVSGEEAAQMFDEVQELCGPPEVERPEGWPTLTPEQAEAAARLF